MNAFEFIERMKKLSEEQQKRIVIGATWDLEDVDCQIENNEDEDFSEMTDAEKLEILERSVNNCGEYGDDEVRDAIMQELELWLVRHKKNKKDEDVSDEIGKCAWCEEEYPIGELHKEVDLGLLCDYCIQAIRSRGEKVTIEE